MPLSRFSAPITAVAFAASAISALAHDQPPLRGRLVFTDHEKPVLHVLDLDRGSVTHSFPVPKPNAGIKTTEDGRFVIITTKDDAGTIRILDTGIIAEPHGDHKDVQKSEAKMLDLAFTGDRPAHVISQNGWVALFYDGPRPWERKGDAKVDLVELKSLAGSQPRIDRWQSPGPQHGIAIPLGNRQWLMSMPNPAYVKGDDNTASSRPNGFDILDRGEAWKTRHSFNDPSKPNASCKLFHGQASRNNTHAFACNEGADGGVLVVSKAKSGQWAARKLAYPDDRRISSLKGNDAGQYFVGNYGLKGPYNALIRVNPNAKSLATNDVMPIPGDQPACQFELDATGKRVANLTPDGKLRVYDIAASFKELAAFDAVPAFDCAFDAKNPKPSLAVIGKSAFISDPSGKRIREFHLDTLKQGLDFAVDGAPTNIAMGGD